MDTSNLEPFAQSMRTILMDGVRQRLRYWGFDDGPEPTHEVESVEGGYLFRGSVHTGEDVPKKWRRLKKAVRDHGIANVEEEAAATWFNRMMAIRILERNGHEMDVLAYAQETRQPALLYNARQGILPYGGDEEKERVRSALQEGDDDEAFRILFTAYCNDHDLLKDVFGTVADYTELLLPTRLLGREGPVDILVTTDAISDDDYEEVELIGWLYQFYISEKKDAVYDKSGKFEAEDIPAATQIFTPNWIVKYLVENTIGRQWLDKHPESDLRDEMEYLVEPEDDEPSDPIFDDLSELKLFDPAAGSGHILVEGFDLLMKMYQEEGYTVRDAVEQILTENLRGMEIDRRAAQLARFALLMKAAQHDNRVLQRADLRPEVYAMPEKRSFSSGDLRAYFGDDVFDQYGDEITDALHLIAEKGQNVGAALHFDLSDDARTAIANRVTHWEQKAEEELIGFGGQDLIVELSGYLKPLLLLTDSYPAVAMNPPYMSSSQMNTELKGYVKEHYPESKRDLFAVFMEVGEEYAEPAGRLGMINQQSWMFLSSYEDLRTHFLETMLVESMLHLGPRTFDEISGEVVQSTAFVLRNMLPQKRNGTYFRLVEEENTAAKKRAFEARENRYGGITQKDFEKIPGEPISYWVPKDLIEDFTDTESFGEVFTLKKGLTTGDTKRFLRGWYEISKKKFAKKCNSTKELDNSNKSWVPYNKGGGARRWYGNQNFVLDYDEESRSEMAELPGHRSDGTKFFFREGITWSNLGSKGFSCRYMPKGFAFDTTGDSAFTKEDIIEYALGFLNSKYSDYLLKALNPTLHFNLGDVARLPFISNENKEFRSLVEGNVSECVSRTAQDYDSSELSWDFKRDALVQQKSYSIESAYDAWRGQKTDNFFQLHASEEELNELFIDLYGLEDELSPRVEYDDVTILEDELDRDALADLDDKRDELSDEELRERLPFKPEVPIRQFLSYGIGVMLGRYRLGHDGLHIAHPNPSADELAPYEVSTPLAVENPSTTSTFEIDDDAIVPLMGQDSPFSDDVVSRMREILRLVWGDDTLTENLNFINRALSIGRSRGLKRDYEKTMEEWLVGDFWDWHKSLYSVPYYGKKPIYWLFQSPEGHFQALVYMHRMNRWTAQQVRQQYLHKYQQYLRNEIQSLEDQGEDSLSSTESKRLETLRQKADDCREYDEILKEVANQQIEIDLDDGVQENYPKFGDAVADL